MANTIKPLKSSLKERKRYLVFEVISEKQVKPEDVLREINSKCLEFMGIFQYGKAGILILRNQFSENKGVIRVSHKYVDYLKAALMLVKDINGIKTSINVRGVSGILKKAKNKFMA